MTINIHQLQENIDIIYNLQEPLQVIDKSTNEIFATIVPNRNNQDESEEKETYKKVK